MITTAQITASRRRAVDAGEWQKTDSLKAKLGHLRQQRCPLFLTETEFDEILRWKLRGQYRRQAHLRMGNTDEVIRQVTGLALTVSHVDEDCELQLRVSILSALRGVGVPVASAVLALVYPDEYAVVDFRVWRQLFGKEIGRAFLVSDYKRYMCKMRPLASELGWSVQEVDMAIWEYDRQHGDRPIG